MAFLEGGRMLSFYGTLPSESFMTMKARQRRCLSFASIAANDSEGEEGKPEKHHFSPPPQNATEPTALIHSFKKAQKHTLLAQKHM